MRMQLSKQFRQNIKSGIMSITVGGVEISNWDRFHYNSIHRAPRPQLVEFLSGHPGEFKSALDLGAGAFADSKYIAKQGIPVRALDLKINGDILLHQYLNNDDHRSVQNNLTVQAQDLAHLQLPKVDLVYSFAALPFCPERNFVNMIVNIASSVNKDGYLALHFFESKHPFVKNGNARGFSTEQLESAFNLLGFTNTQTTQWTDEKLQSGERLPNLNNIFLTAKGPEKLAEFSREDLQQILGLRVQQEDPEDPALAPVSKVYGFSCGTDGKPHSIEPIGTPIPQQNITTSTAEESEEQSSIGTSNSEEEDLSSYDINPLEKEEGKEIYKTAPTDQISAVENYIDAEKIGEQTINEGCASEYFTAEGIKEFSQYTNMQEPVPPQIEDFGMEQ